LMDTSSGTTSCRRSVCESCCGPILQALVLRLHIQHPFKLRKSRPFLLIINSAGPP
jgi:hypothetical protein